MDVVHGWHEVPQHLKGGSLAIGTFDGVHRGHRVVLNAAKANARAGGLAVGAMMFQPYPRMYFQPQKPFFRLTQLPRKLQLLSECGLDFTAVIPFDKTLASCPPPSSCGRFSWRDLRSATRASDTISTSGKAAAETRAFSPSKAAFMDSG